MQVMFHGQPMRLLGLPLKVGELTSQRLRYRARNVRVIGNNLSPVLPLARSQGKIRLFVRLNEDAMLKTLKFWYTIWTDSALQPTASKVALVVGSLLFAINHGSAVLRGEMTRERWLIGLFTYLVPYTVSIHGQYSTRS